MSLLQFENKDCRKVRALLDSYLNNELLVETNHEVIKHLEACKACAAEYEAKTRIKKALQNAVRKDVAPAGLQQMVQRQIRQQQPRPRFQWPQWAMAAAAALVLAVGTWGVFIAVRSGKLPGPAPQAQLDTDAQVLNIGFANHVHCAIDRDFAGKHFTGEEMSAKLGDFIGLVSLVKSKVPAGFDIVVGHRCKFNGREFVHLILKKQEQVVSVTLTRKDGEAFSPGAAGEIAEASGISLHPARLQGYEITGFETRDYLAFVTSNLQRPENVEMARALAPAVRDFIRKFEV